MGLKSVAAAAALLVATAAAAQPASIEQRRAALDRDLPRLLAERGIPSVSIAQVEEGRVVLTAAYGERSAGVPATTETLYNIASLTKPVSAEVVLRLASAGKLSLDEPMYPLWTDPEVAGDPRHRLLTPRIALSHQTGFPNWRFLAADGKLAFGDTPGEAVGYSGEGYEWTARFTEKKTGRPFEALAQELVLNPAGMRATAYTRRPWFEGRVAIPTDDQGRALKPSLRDAFLASDDIHTTAADYAQFLVEVIERKGLSPAIAAERQAIQASTRHLHCAGAKEASCPVRMGFGLGWEVLEFPERTILWHTGADSGEFAIAYIDLKGRSGTVILTNSRKGHGIVLEVMERLEADPVFLRALRAQTGQ
jgi:CubicO group peptidase (beta-lactamase class C family)